MKKRLTFQQLLFEQQVLGILLFTMLVVFLWVVSSIYFSYSASTLSVDDTTTVIPLDPAIPDKPLRELAGRKWWSDEELTQFSPSVTLSSENSQTALRAAPVASSTARPTSTPVATSSASR